MSSSHKPLILITGANQGLGYHTAQQLASSGSYHVLLGSRSSEKGAAAVQSLINDASHSIPTDALTPLTIDITSDASITAAASEVQAQHGHLDILINNAGIFLPGTSREDYTTVFNANVFGAAAVTEAFLPLLRTSTYADRRIVNISSGLGLLALALSDRPYNATDVPAIVYRTSKAALNMLTVTQAKLFEGEGISVVCCSPGHCQTAMNGYTGTKTAEDGAKCIARAATEGKGADVTGTYVSDEGEGGLGW